MASSRSHPPVGNSSILKTIQEIEADASRLNKDMEEAVMMNEAAAEADKLEASVEDAMKNPWSLLDPEQLEGLDELRRERTGSQEHLNEEMRLLNLSFDLFKAKKMKKYQEEMARAVQRKAKMDKIRAETVQLQARINELKEMRSEIEKQKNTPERQRLRSRINRQWEMGSDNRKERMHLIEGWVLNYQGY
ncbi:hypothetical protein BDN70DRAFT_886638 [Pholiota conissans]|uniref:Uncharacterized protein n=1 Tax=Pholiota conissans TaxID=109636 RepID=A0A9P5YMY1_9AGAR|nr:hypothetical protein BDN70DRAFT_886638 [Pholiota conissans]